MAAHSVYTAESILADLRAGKPQDTRKHPIAIRVRAGQCLGIGLSGRTPADEDGTERVSAANLHTQNVPAPRCFEAAGFFARAVLLPVAPAVAARVAIRSAIVFPPPEVGHPKLDCVCKLN